MSDFEAEAAPLCEREVFGVVLKPPRMLDYFLALACVCGAAVFAVTLLRPFVGGSWANVAGLSVAMGGAALASASGASWQKGRVRGVFMTLVVASVLYCATFSLVFFAEWVLGKGWK